MKLHKPLLENLEKEKAVREDQIEWVNHRIDALEDFKDELSSHMSYNGQGRKVISGQEFVEGLHQSLGIPDEGLETLEDELENSIDGFEVDRTYDVRKIGKFLDRLDEMNENAESELMEGLKKIHAVGLKFNEEDRTDSDYLPADWSPVGDVFFGSEDEKMEIDSEMFQSDLIADPLEESNTAERLEELDSIIGYLEDTLELIQDNLEPEYIESTENLFEEEDFTFPLFEGLTETLRMARRERDGLEHLLMYNDDHEYHLNRWENKLAHDLRKTEWTIYGKETDYFEKEDLMQKKRLESSDSPFYRDGEFDLLLKNGDKYAYIEVKSSKSDKDAERANTQLDNSRNYDEVIIKNNGSYETIEIDDLETFWTNTSPDPKTDYALDILEGGSNSKLE